MFYVPDQIIENMGAISVRLECVDTTCVCWVRLRNEYDIHIRNKPIVIVLKCQK